MSRVLLVWIAGLFLLGPGTVRAQAPLNSTDFINTWNWVFDDTVDSDVDTLGVGTPFSGSAGSGGYDLSWNVSYGPSSAPPEATATSQISFNGGGDSILYGSAGADIRFEIRVIQIATPPTPVSEVPVSFRAQGTVASSGGDASMFGEAQAFFQVGPDADPLILEFRFANFNAPDGGFSVDEVHALTVGEVVRCWMGVVSFAYTDSPGTSRTEDATAFVDPVIEVLDTTIPSTNQSYRSFFTIQFSPGYSDATPTRKTTWGSIKRMYGALVSPAQGRR